MVMVLIRVDDLTEEPQRADETVFFELDGATYEIDLTAAHAAQLRGQLEPYISAGRRTGWRKVPRRPIGPWNAETPVPANPTDGSA